MRFISIDQLKEGMVLSKNIYDSDFKLLLRSGSSLSLRYIHRIQDLGYQGIYIKDELSQDLDIDDIIDDSLRIEAFTTIKSACEHAYHYARNENQYALGVDKHYQATSSITNKLISNLKKSKIDQINLIDLKIFEDYIVSHCVNVGVLSLFLGIALGLSTVELQRLGAAALLHDVGKMFLDPKVLNKTDRLTAEEFKQINMHSSFSYRYVKESINVHTTTNLGILYHHEKIDGSGYPKGKKGNDIPLFSRIISICDVYDALTSNRPQRPPLLPSEAMEYMLANGGSTFDMDILKVFTKKIAPFPIGIEVILSNHEKGIVVENYKELPLRPSVRLYSDSSGQKIDPRIVSLKNDHDYLNVTIKEVVHTKNHL